MMCSVWDTSSSRTTVPRKADPGEPFDPAVAPTLPAEPAFEFDDTTVYALSVECHLSEESAVILVTLDGELMLAVEDTEDPISHGVVAIGFSESSLFNILDGFNPFNVDFG